MVEISDYSRTRTDNKYIMGVLSRLAVRCQGCAIGGVGGFHPISPVLATWFVFLDLYLFSLRGSTRNLLGYKNQQLVLPGVRYLSTRYRILVIYFGLLP